MKQKIINLEEKIMHLEITVDELNKTAYKQQLQIDKANTTIKKLITRYQESQYEILEHNEIPPHY